MSHDGVELGDLDEATEVAAESPATEKAVDIYGDVGQWVQGWFAPSMAGKVTGEGMGVAWCPQWWRHEAVAVRLHALWQAWEVACRDPDEAALSGWWVGHADPHLRALTNGENGPMGRCTTERHRPTASWPSVPAPAGWFVTGPDQIRSTPSR